jgi:hypothetical protein
MYKYRIGMREVHVNWIGVESETELSDEEAKDFAEKSLYSGEFDDDLFEYSHTLKKDTWTVEKV